MQLLSVLNNTLQITFNPEENQLKLGDILEFVIPSNNGVIAQIFKIGLENDEYIANLRIFFTVKDGNWIKWIGNIPPKSSIIQKVPEAEVLELFSQNAKNTLNLGFMPQFDCNMKVALKNLGGTFVLFDNNQNKLDLFNNLKDEFIKTNTPFVIFDFKNEYSSKKAPKISALKDFKLPLNVDSLTSIYEKNFQYSSSEMKVLFEDVIAQIKNFFNQSDEIFIPFKIFKSVIDNEQPSIELTLLKNLLDKYQEQGLFADSKADFLRLKAIFKKHNAFIIDMSNIPEEWHKEYVKFIISNLNKFFIMLEDEGFLKNNKDIDEIFAIKKSVKFITAINYSSEQLGSFIQKAQNLILFPSNKKINYFPNLIDYINLLSYEEFIYQGEQTKYVPVVLQPKQDKEKRIIKSISTVREVIKKPEEEIIKPAKIDEIEDIISEIEVLHSEEENVPLIQEADDFEQIDVENIESLEELDELQSYGEDDFFSEDEEPSIQEFEVVEVQDEMDENLDELFDDELMNDIDSLYSSKSEPQTSKESPKNTELHEKIEEQKIQEIAQQKADEIDAQTDLEDELFGNLDELEELEELEELNELDELEDFDELEELEELDNIQELEEAQEAELPTEKPKVTSEPTEQPAKPAPRKSQPQEIYEPQEEIPEYPVEENLNPKNQDITFKNGDMIEHEKFGKGIIKKIVSHGSKKLYKIHFETQGVKLLDLDTVKVNKY